MRLRGAVGEAQPRCLVPQQRPAPGNTRARSPGHHVGSHASLLCREEARATQATGRRSSQGPNRAREEASDARRPGPDGSLQAESSQLRPQTSYGRNTQSLGPPTGSASTIKPLFSTTGFRVVGSVGTAPKHLKYKGRKKTFFTPANL